MTWLCREGDAWMLAPHRRKETVKGIAMKMRKWMIIFFWAILIVPNLLWLALSPYRTAEGENAEKRELAPFPRLGQVDLKGYPAAVEAYINDHAAFREQLLSLNAGIDLVLFRSVSNPEVILGEEGWYFYNGGSSVADYRGQNLYTEEELALIGAKLEAVRQYYENRGIQFAVLLAPNKESVYSEYMPKWYTKLSPVTRYDQVEQCLKERTGIPVIAPKAYYLEDRDLEWYFKTDTHWNEAGAFVAGQMLIDAVGGQAVATEDVIIPYEQRDRGDLAMLVHMPESFLDDQFCVVHGYYDEVAVETADVKGDGSVRRSHAPDAPDPRRLSFYGDSFVPVMLSKISRYFRDVDFYHWQSFTLQELEEAPPDILVYEVVERELGRILEDADKLMPQTDLLDQS